MTTTRPERGLARPFTFGVGGGPFTALQRFAEDVDRIFEEFGMPRSLSPWSGAGQRGWWAPAIDVVQEGDQLVIRADVPGMKKEDLSLEVSEDAITIQGERRAEREDDRGGVYRSERSYGSFCRVVPLPEGAMTDQAKASFRDGVLEITVPVPPGSPKGRKLEISEASEGARGSEAQSERSRANAPAAAGTR
jgi:HSP20 family protein